MAPIRHAFSLTVDGYPSGMPGVSSLLNAGSPLAIIGAVISIIIDAFKHQSFWWKSHVSKECIKAIPLSANRYSPASVILVLFVVWIAASLNHAGPNVIQGSSLPLSGLSMFEKGLVIDGLSIKGFGRHNFVLGNVVFSGGLCSKHTPPRNNPYFPS